MPSADAGGFSAAQQAHDPHLCRQGEGFHAVEEQCAAIRQLAFAGPAAFPIESKQFARIRLRGMPPQCTATKGASRRRPALWMA